MPPANYFGSQGLTVKVSDGDLFAFAEFNLTVYPVNDAPVMDDLSDASIEEDNVYTLELSGTDVDEDHLTFLASINGNGSVSVDGFWITVSPTADFNGDNEVNVIVFCIYPRK